MVIPHSGKDCLKLYAADFFLFIIFVICNKQEEPTGETNSPTVKIESMQQQIYRR